MIYKGHPDQRWGHITYAQHGDDLMLLNLIELMGLKKPSYLDLGAHHPETISNTKLLYDRGLRGVNVEANPVLFEKFMSERPEDKNVNVGVGLEDGSAPFYMYSATCGLNTFSAEEAKSSERSGFKIRSEVVLPVMTLATIIDNYCGGKYPEILSCDIEGLDYAILKTANFSETAPLIICVETRKNASAEMRSLLLEKGYFCYCRLGENLFFIHKNYYGSCY